MDYDENSFQSQNVQLAADDNKFPQSLPPLSLPKFDFDEHLHVNFRFDSLVADTDIILGIQAQNTWIEDISSGNCAIEFSSSPPNTNIFHRHKNVWSEETSSESVEMLLKYVGEDEMNNNRAVTMEANPQNDSGDLIKQVNSTSKTFHDSNSRMKNKSDVDRSMLLDTIESNLLGRDKDESEVVRQSTESDSNVPTSDEHLRKLDAQRECSSFLSNYDAQKESSSFLEPAGDSLLLINDGCQVTGILNNHDGLLDAFASQVNAFNTGSKAAKVEEKYIVTNNQNEEDLVDNEAAKESSTDINSKVAFKFTEVENTEGNYSNLDTHTSEIETVIVEKYIRVNIFDDEESGSTLIPQENAVISRSSDILHNLAKAYSHTTLDAYALEKDDASSVSIDFTCLKNDANDLEGKMEATKNSGGDGSGFGVPSTEDSTNRIQSHLDGSHSKNISCELKETTSPESQAHESVITDATEMKVTADVPSVQVHALKDAIPADLVLEPNAVEVSNKISSECVKLKETDAKISSNSNFTQIEDYTDNRQLEDPDLCLNLKEVSNQISSGCMEAGETEANSSSNSDFTQLEGSADSRKSEEPDLCVNAKGVSNQISSECMKVQFHAFKDKLNADLLQKQNTREISNPTSSECMKLKEMEANISPNSYFGQLECNVDSTLLEYPDCVPSEVINQVSSEWMKSKETVANISNSVFTQLEGNRDNRQSEDQDSCVNANEVSNQISSECMKPKETEANVSSNSVFTQLEGNADNRQLEVPDLCVNAKEVSNQISSECMNSEEAEAHISSNSISTQLEGNADCMQLKYSDCVNERDASNQNSSVCMKSKETEANLSSNSNFTQLEGYIDNRQLEGPELCLNVNDVSNQISLECMQSKEPEAIISSNSNFTQLRSNADNRQLEDPDICVNSSLKITPRTFKGVQSSCHLESCDTTDTSQCDLQPHSLHKKPITHRVSTVVEEKFVSENEKNMSDNPHTSSDDSKQSVRNSGEPPSRNEYSKLPGPSPPTQNLSGKDLLPVVTSKTSSGEPSCCSPTIISDVPFHTKVEGANSPVQLSTLPVHTSLISSETGDKVDIIKNITPDPEKSTTIENDISFSFEVGNIVDMSEKITSNQLKLSPGVLSSGTPKTPKEIDMGTNEKKSTKPRAKSTKWISTHKSCSNSVGISSTASSKSFGTGYSVFQIDDVQPKAKSSRKKKSGSPFIQKSCLPDLNSSVSASTLVCQPFFDLQQVQLRAQIYVYGSLIENKPPDEAYMQSAFGEKDGGRSTWETVWRKSVDRYQTQKSFLNPETPLLSYSVLRVPKQETKSPSVQSKVTSTSANNKSICKSIASATPSTPLPLPFPIWNMIPNSPRTAQFSFHQALTPLHPYPSSQTRQFACNTTPWISSNTRPAPWVICSPSPALKSARHSLSVPAVDTVKITSVRESSMPYTSLLSSPMPVNIPLDPHGKTAIVQKSKTWKKSQETKDVFETILVSQPAPTPVVHKSLPITLPFMSPTTKPHAMVATEQIVAAVPHNFSDNYQMINSVSSAEIAKASKEVGKRIQQAKLQAEEAASLAASVASHSQSIWNQLAAQENSSLSSEIEAKLAAAVAAGAAATSVARAAAAVAKVASETALQAKMMADEATGSAKTEVIFDARKSLPMLTPGSNLEGEDKMHGSSLITASDPARIIVEETSATTKRVKNLEAIMKAAELAAEAVSHVGTLIAMGDPLPFNPSDLLEAGPDSSWKAYIKANKLKGLEKSESAPSANKEMQQTVLKEGEHQPVQSEENGDGSVEKSSTFPNESHENDPGNLKEYSFRKGSLVEVIFDEGRFKGGWFSARVLDVEDNKVHVCYNNLLSDDGSAQLREWVSLDRGTNEAPRIRIAHPHNITKNGTKKRRREVASDHVWEIGDHVAAWMHDGWWEGIITEKNQLDETKLTVHFPDSCDSSVIRAWDLRTSLSWKEGQWTEWSRTKEGNLKAQEQGDTPQEKRQKLDRNETKTDTEVGGKVSNTLSKKSSLKNTKIAEEPRPLNLSTKYNTVSVGKKEDNVSAVAKGKRTGPRKEGSGVPFGGPKGPVKKQKFMDVSKHYYGSDKADKPNHGMGPLKFPEYLMPQLAHSWRNTSKTAPREKQAVNSRSVGVKPFRSLTTNSSSRNAKQKYINPTVNTDSYSEKQKSSSVNKGDIGVKGRLPSDKSIRSEKKSEASEKLVPDASEPRRSNRRIQPSSRLLEGLQSSMMMSNIPTTSHEKSSKKLHRGSSSRGNTRG